jgi:UDP-N-acetylmuramoyl-L-alanyl-D-glutamate--2,6-diaminopimelate ligase
LTVCLKDILTVLESPEASGDLSVRLSAVTHDSRKVQPGSLFVAMRGETSDGHGFVGKAVAAGAAAVLAEKPRASEHGDLPWVVVPDTRKVLGRVASMVYGRPTSRLTVVGITGTNGKTTLTFLLEGILNAAGRVPGVMGTITYRWSGVERPAHHTTPEASDVQGMLAEMATAGVTHAIMEVSSHGLHLGRLDGCEFDVGVFTNLTQDHLDFHGDFELYFLAKQALFNKLLSESSKEKPAAVVNLDDPYGRRLAQEIKALPVTGFGSNPNCAIHPLNVSLAADGITGTIATPRGTLRIRSPLTGPFNLSNIMAAIAVSEQLAISTDAIQAGIEAVGVVPGRLERVPSQLGTVFVDYAHTPGALKNVLDALRIIRTGRIITIMGCGGDRDKTKRPLMGMEAAAGSDFVVVTSDNPRSEEPLAIIGQVEAGVRDYGFSLQADDSHGQFLKSRCYRVIPDRREAIDWAVKHLGNGDILLVAGKGHETYQEINGVRYPFDDRKVVRDALERRKTHKVEGAGGDHGQGRLPKAFRSSLI